MKLNKSKKNEDRIRRSTGGSYWNNGGGIWLFVSSRPDSHFLLLRTVGKMVYSLRGEMMEKESIEAIKRKYTDEWVLISDYETDEFLVLLNGVVVAHSKNREEIYNLQWR